MGVQCVPVGFKIITGIAIFILTFWLFSPSDLATLGQIACWK